MGRRELLGWESGEGGRMVRVVRVGGWEIGEGGRMVSVVRVEGWREWEDGL